MPEDRISVGDLRHFNELSERFSILIEGLLSKGGGYIRYLDFVCTDSSLYAGAILCEFAIHFHSRNQACNLPTKSGTVQSKPVQR
jgi:hypothetical protein